MKRFPLLVILLSSIGLYSCNMEPKNHTAEISKMEDTLFKAFPSVNRVSIEVKDDFGTEVHITLGDATLYNANEDQRLAVTKEAAAITSYVFAGDAPKKGSVIFVQEENTIHTDKGSEKTYEMPLATSK